MSDERAPSASGPLLRRCFPARATELRSVREAVRREALAQGCAPECAGDFVMAVDEACQNIIRHAYAGRSDGEIVLEIERSGGDLRSSRCATSHRRSTPPGCDLAISTTSGQAGSGRI